MIFNNAPKLGSNTNEGVSRYLQGAIYGWFLNLITGLTKLSFGDNFESFTVNNISIAAGETATITNQLKITPSARLIIRQSGNSLVTDGTWNAQSLQLINNGASDVTVSVIYFR